MAEHVLLLMWCSAPFFTTFDQLSDKNNCQKISPAHSVITKCDLILWGSYFCEKYNYMQYIYYCVCIGLAPTHSDNRIEPVVWNSSTCSAALASTV